MFITRWSSDCCRYDNHHWPRRQQSYYHASFWFSGYMLILYSLQWCYNERDGVSNTGVSIVYSTVCLGSDQRKKSKLPVTGLCEGKSLVAGELPVQRASNAEFFSIWWREHIFRLMPMLWDNYQRQRPELLPLKSEHQQLTKILNANQTSS